MKLALAAVVAFGCGTSLPPTVDVAANNPEPLRDLANGFMIGTSIDNEAFNTEPLYQDIVAHQFDALVPENKMKMAALQRTRGTWDFTDADALVSFAQAHGMKVRGHTLVYPNGSPKWLLAITSADDLETVMTTHISKVMTHWPPGSVPEWDVVNEPYDYNPGDLDPVTHLQIPPALDNKIFTKLLTEQYITDALSTARMADPSAKLFINENGIELGGQPIDHAKLETLAAKAAALHAMGLLDGVGMEFHVPLDFVDDTTLDHVRCAMAELTATGVEIHVTELDVRIKLPASDDELAKQAQFYAGVLDACRSNPMCTGFLVWGFTDRWSWIPGQYSGYGEADLLDDTYAFKPAYTAVQDALRAAPSGLGCTLPP